MRKAASIAAAVIVAAALAGGWVAAAPVASAGMPTLAASDAAAAADEAEVPLLCSGTVSAGSATAPAATYEGGAVTGTTPEDLRAFAHRYNELRIAACLEPLPAERIVWSPCLEERLVWMATDPSGDPASAWGHAGSVRSDGMRSRGCDGNLAGGDGNTGSTVATKWWDSAPHRASLYRPGEDFGDGCVAFAMTHGGVPDEPASFTRAAAIRTAC